MIKNISVFLHTSAFYASYQHSSHYIINKGMENEKKIFCCNNYSDNINRTKIENDNSFVNGFKLVEYRPSYYTKDFLTGKPITSKFAYMNDSGQMIPYLFDIATDFDEYGYAIVGNDGKLTMIDKDFNYVSVTHGLVSGKINYEFDEITKFSDGVRPLAKLTVYKEKYEQIRYLRTDGKFQKFHRCTPSGFIGSDSTDTHLNTSEFNKLGLATTRKGNYNQTVILSSGVEINIYDLINLLGDKTILQLDEEFYKKIKSKFENYSDKDNDLQSPQLVKNSKNNKD